MNMILTDETLSAYLDGELEPSVARAVEAALAEDESARQELEQLKQLRSLVTESYDELLAEPLPVSLVASVQGQLRATADTAPAATNPLVQAIRAQPYAALAAAILLTVFTAFPAGVFWATERQEVQLAALEAQLRADQTAFAQTVSEALEQHLSGDSVYWENPESGNSGTVTPIRTFKNVDGEWCREYQEKVFLDGELRAQRAIACRSGSGAWQTRVISLEES